jgi:hypothetical protein
MTRMLQSIAAIDFLYAWENDPFLKEYEFTRSHYFATNRYFSLVGGFLFCEIQLEADRSHEGNS